MTGPAADRPRTLRVELVSPPAPGPSPWAEPTRYLREIAKWMTGGVIATAAAVATGSSLSNIGALDPLQDSVRLGLAAAGLFVAVIGIGVIMRFAVTVLQIDAASLDSIAAAERGALARTRKAIERHYAFGEDGRNWPEAVKVGSPLGDQIERSAPYFSVRGRFDQLVAVLPFAVLVTIMGLVLFAWAANPPTKPGGKAPLLVITLP